MHEAAALLLTVFGLRGLYRLGRLFGTLEWLINFKRRNRFGRALQTILGELSGPQRRRYTHEHFMHTRCDKLYYLVFDRIPREKALAGLTVHNLSLLDDSLARGRGVYVALSHHGPLHIAGMLFALRGYKIAGVRDRREGGMRRYIQSLYDRKYPEFRRVRVLYSDSFPREIYRCLQEGSIVASAMDVSRIRDPKQRSHEVTLFGRSQHFLTGPLRIALRCRTPILQAFIVPRPDFRYELFLEEPLAGEFEDEEIAVAKAIEQYARNVEKFIRDYPSLLTRA